MSENPKQPRRPGSGSAAGSAAPGASDEAREGKRLVRPRPAERSKAEATASGESAPNDKAKKEPGSGAASARPLAEVEPAEAESTEAESTEAADGGGTDRPSGWKLLVHLGRPRATRAQLVVALLCGLLGFALVTQVHSQAGSGLSSARQADLVDVLDNLSARSEQLQSQIADEEQTLSRLTGGTGQTEAALEEAQQRATTLRILAGTIGATGPGVDLRIADPDHSVTADVLLDTLEELRDAGAEAVEIRGGGTPAPEVRLVASSYFVDSQDGHGVIADGTALLPPYDILAIGDPPTLAQAMGIPGGVLDTLKGKHAQGVVSQLGTVRITALHALTPPQYARPAASASAGS